MNTTSRFYKLQSLGFVLGLVLLLLNDFVLKTTFHNWVTGKLSDLAGLFIFPLFWSVFFPKQSLLVYGATALGFVIWKSPMSDGFIQVWNSLPYLFDIARVVDYSDYLALGVLPFSHYYFKSNHHLRCPLSPQLLVIVAGFAFMATSRPAIRKTFHYNTRYKTGMSRRALLKKLSQINDLNRRDIRPRPAILMDSVLVDTLKFTLHSAHLSEVRFEIYTHQSQTCLSLKQIQMKVAEDKKKIDSYRRQFALKQFEAIIVNQLGTPVTKF